MKVFYINRHKLFTDLEYFMRKLTTKHFLNSAILFKCTRRIIKWNLCFKSYFMYSIAFKYELYPNHFDNLKCMNYETRNNLREMRVCCNFQFLLYFRNYTFLSEQVPMHQNSKCTLIILQIRLKTLKDILQRLWLQSLD